jgi:hypothetical protein
MISLGLALCIGLSVAAPGSYYNSYGSYGSYQPYRSQISYAVAPTYATYTKSTPFTAFAAVKPTFASPVARSNYVAQTSNAGSRSIQTPRIASLQPATDNNRRVNSDFYAKKAFQFPIAVSQAIRASRSADSPNAAAALAYMKNVGNDDICARSTQAYLEEISKGSSVDQANSAATKKYIDDYNSGMRVERGSACEASDIAWRKAEADGADPVVASAMAFMENWPGTKEGNPCAVSGRDYVNAILEGADHLDANLLAAKSFAGAIKSLAAQGKELRDPSCAAATKAFYNGLAVKPSPPNAAAMLAFLDKAFDGFSFSYDPVCFRATESFFDSYAKGNDELVSNRLAAETFLEEFAKGGAGIPADSPCAASTRAYYANIPNPPSLANRAAMEAFMNKMIRGGRRAPDPACADSMKAYLAAYKNGASETDANLAAAESFFKSFSSGQTIAADSPCAAATKAYFNNLEDKPSNPNAQAMIAFMDGMIAQGNKRVFDPVCAKASTAFFDSYKAGNDELTSNFRAARAFIQEYKKGAKVATNSPCLQATKVYAANIKNAPSPPSASAMLAFLDEAIIANFNKPDDVCLTSAEAYFDAYLSGKSEAASNEIAGVAFLDAVSASSSYDPSSPCGVAARAYMANLDL